MPQAKNYTYTILRNGTPIGKHTMSITPSAGATTIEEATDIEVKVIFVTAYRMHTASREIWIADRWTISPHARNDSRPDITRQQVWPGEWPAARMGVQPSASSPSRMRRVRSR